MGHLIHNDCHRPQIRLVCVVGAQDHLGGEVAHRAHHLLRVEQFAAFCEAEVADFYEALNNVKAVRSRAGCFTV
jgi:hypothetical protein